MAILGVFAFYSNPVVGQEEVPDDEYEWCQFIDRPDRPEIDGCKVAYFDHICPCE
ncbi:hypothetical protein Belba_1565 [Belliella baltica DSM 15883]|uniref:Uncharacterized protein n=2 Tax=Belliella TaxID=232244 RepID=I3Z4J5_BELBD|nr:hypothetical protein Belba_1551 [Belliella baltica DSM 15883]AFL84175.1 hypothetical protein Belba_1565 [Belliella baltica DSM 15883]